MYAVLRNGCDFAFFSFPLNKRSLSVRCVQRRQQQFTTTTLTGDDQQQPQQKHALRVAVIGSPNVGKSALTNALVRTNVCAVSRQIDTTRRNTMTALTEDMCQLVVVDSPGLIGTGHARRMAGVTSDEPILSGPTRAIERAQHILVVHDVTMPGEFLNHRLLYFLHRFSHIPSCLVLNKVDLVTDRGQLAKLAHTLTEGTVDGQTLKTERVKLGKLGEMISRSRNAKNSRKTDDEGLAGGPSSFSADGSADSADGIGIHPAQRPGRDEEWHRLYNQLISKPAHRGSWSLTRKLFGDQLGWPNFSALFFVSALRGDGIDELRHHLRSLAQGVDKWNYTADKISTADPRMLCAEHTRSALLNRCPGYIAYALRTRITEWEEPEQSGGGALRIAVDVFCDQERWVRVVGACAADIEREQCQWLARLFSMPVEFRLFVCGPDRKRRFFDEQLEEVDRQQQMKRNKKAEQEQQQHVEMSFEQLVMGGGRRGGDATVGGGVAGTAPKGGGGRQRRTDGHFR